jgi:hypothetical protein
MKAKTANPKDRAAPKDREGGRRIIGVDLHPDVFSAAALSPRGHDLGRAQVEWTHDRQPVAKLEA